MHDSSAQYGRRTKIKIKNKNQYDLVRNHGVCRTYTQPYRFSMKLFCFYFGLQLKAHSLILFCEKNRPNFHFLGQGILMLQDLGRKTLRVVHLVIVFTTSGASGTPLPRTQSQSVIGTRRTSHQQREATIHLQDPSLMLLLLICLLKHLLERECCWPHLA